jgi:hypothetical protein
MSLTCNTYFAAARDLSLANSTLLAASKSHLLNTRVISFTLSVFIALIEIMRESCWKQHHWILRNISVEAPFQQNKK